MTTGQGKINNFNFRVLSLFEATPPELHATTIFEGRQNAEKICVCIFFTHRMAVIKEETFRVAGLTLFFQKKKSIPKTVKKHLLSDTGNQTTSRKPIHGENTS